MGNVGRDVLHIFPRVSVRGKILAIPGGVEEHTEGVHVGLAKITTLPEGSQSLIDQLGRHIHCPPSDQRMKFSIALVRCFFGMAAASFRVQRDRKVEIDNDSASNLLLGVRVDFDHDVLEGDVHVRITEGMNMRDSFRNVSKDLQCLVETQVPACVDELEKVVPVNERHGDEKLRWVI